MAYGCIDRLLQSVQMGDLLFCLAPAFGVQVKALVQWCEDSSYRMIDQQCLEEVIENQNLTGGIFTLDLYLPVEA